MGNIICGQPLRINSHHKTDGSWDHDTNIKIRKFRIRGKDTPIPFKVVFMFCKCYFVFFSIFFSGLNCFGWTSFWLRNRPSAIYKYIKSLSWHLLPLLLPCITYKKYQKNNNLIRITNNTTGIRSSTIFN